MEYCCRWRCLWDEELMLPIPTNGHGMEKVMAYFVFVCLFVIQSSVADTSMVNGQCHFG
jgi:hypothetical protein